MKIKITKSLFFFVAIFFTLLSAGAQNMSINIITLNSGLVNVGGTVQLQVDVTNTDPTAVTLVANKARPQISVPMAICNIAATGHTLPSGWTITSNNGTTIRITNTSDPIPAGETRTAFIVIQGNVIGGSSPILANLTFVGPAPSGDLGADNSATSSIQVSTVTPLVLTNFEARLTNCKPTLSWTTEMEINSASFEVERTTSGIANWVSAGVVNALGNTTNKYIFSDNSTAVNSEKILYRLKIIDRDGRYKYSPVLPVMLNCNKNIVSVFPNPVQDGNLYLSITGTNSYQQATLLSLSGQVLLKRKIANGTSYIDVSKITKGMYVLSIQNTAGVNKNVKVFINN